MSHFIKAIIFAVIAVVALSLELKADDKRELNIAFGYDKPPYVIQKNETGFYLEVTRAALNEVGIAFHPEFVSAHRMLALHENPNYDAIGGIPPINDKLCHSTPFVEFQNVAVTKEGDGNWLKEMSDLKGRSIVTFQNADIILGKTFREATANNKVYVNVASQRIQVRSFLAGRFDVAVLDRHIFTWWKAYFEELENHPDKMKVKFSKIFPWKKNFGLEFRDKKLCAEFNRGLESIKNNGVLAALESKFLNTENVIRMARQAAK